MTVVTPSTTDRVSGGATASTTDRTSAATASVTDRTSAPTASVASRVSGTATVSAPDRIPSRLLLETGDFLLLETGDKLLLDGFGAVTPSTTDRV